MSQHQLERPERPGNPPAFRPIHDIDISTETPAQAERAGRARPAIVVSYPDCGEITRVTLDSESVDAIDVFTDGHSVHVLSRSKRLETARLDTFAEGRRVGAVHVCGELAIRSTAGEDFWLLTPAAMAERLAPGTPENTPLPYRPRHPEGTQEETAQMEERSRLRRIVGGDQTCHSTPRVLR